MNNKRCKVCFEEFHYCSSCDYDEAMYSGFCDEECLNKFYNRDLFEKWFENLTSGHKGIQFDILSGVKGEMWGEWMQAKDDKPGEFTKFQGEQEREYKLHIFNDSELIDIPTTEKKVKA